MKIEKLGEMTGGWFVGDFTPAVLQNKNFEVAVKRYRAGQSEARHCHRQAVELTLIVSGQVRMNGVACGPDDILVLEPGEWADFTAITDAVNVVVKTPSVRADKFLEGE